MGLLAQGQSKTVLLAALGHGLFDVLGQAIKTVRWTSPTDPLMGTLVIIVLHPVVQTLAAVGERGEHSLFKILTPERLPEPLDLAQRHRMVWRRTNMLDTLLLEHLLEPALTTPGHELTAVV